MSKQQNKSGKLLEVIAYFLTLVLPGIAIVNSNLALDIYFGKAYFVIAFFYILAFYAMMFLFIGLGLRFSKNLKPVNTYFKWIFISVFLSILIFLLFYINSLVDTQNSIERHHSFDSFTAYTTENQKITNTFYFFFVFMSGFQAVLIILIYIKLWLSRNKSA